MVWEPLVICLCLRTSTVNESSQNNHFSRQNQCVLLLLCGFDCSRVMEVLKCHSTSISLSSVSVSTAAYGLFKLMLHMWWLRGNQIMGLQSVGHLAQTHKKLLLMQLTISGRQAEGKFAIYG